MNVTLDMGPLLVLFLLFIVVFYFIYSRTIGIRGPSRNGNNLRGELQEPMQKSLEMISTVGATMGAYTKDAVVVSIPLDVLNQSDYSVSELFRMITQVDSDKSDVPTEPVIGAGSSKPNNTGASNGDDIMSQLKGKTIEKVKDEESTWQIDNIDDVEEDDSILNPAEDLELLEKLARDADGLHTNEEDEGYEIIGNLD